MYDYVKIDGIKYPVAYRAHTSDEFVLRGIFVDKEYELAKITPEPKFIIDGGACGGCASVYFANMYPEARIIAIEPDAQNFELLSRNIEPYPNVKGLRAGLCGGNRDKWLRIKNPDRTYGDFVSYVTEETDKDRDDSIPGLTIGNILKKSGFERIDILKLDVEGAEKYIFESNYEYWLSRTNIVIVELHDRFMPGSAKAFFRAISKYNFTLGIPHAPYYPYGLGIKGENLFFYQGASVT